MTQRTLLKVTLPDGSTESNYTTAAYTHVSAYSYQGRWHVWSWHKSRQAAEKLLPRMRSHADGEEPQILTVEAP